jgi:hypothetical protein
MHRVEGFFGINGDATDPLIPQNLGSGRERREARPQPECSEAVWGSACRAEEDDDPAPLAVALQGGGPSSTACVGPAPDGSGENW